MSSINQNFAGGELDLSSSVAVATTRTSDGEIEAYQASDTEACMVHVDPVNNASENEVIYVGKEFASADDAYNYYNAYAKNKGFGIRKMGTERSRRPPNEVICRKHCCCKEGVKKQEEFDVKRRIDSRVNCPAEMHIRLKSFVDKKIWKVTKFIDSHSHILTSPDKVYNYYSHKTHRSKVARTIMSNLDDEGMRASNIARVVNAINSGGDGEHVSAQQCNDYIRHKSNNIGQEVISIIISFQDRREADPDFYFAMEVDHEGTLRSVFWADGRARSSYLSFGDVVVFDTTYKTNHLNLPFAPFTGVNHHRQSTLFGCALLADEQKETFVWLFTQWLKCMHGVAPKAIITDQDAQIGGAIKEVFPNARHRFCSWHIRKHIVEQEISLKTKYGDEISIDFNDWLHSRNISICENRWRAMKEKYDINEEEDSWLSKMYRLREYWVDAYLKDNFWAGMTTSQRSESINSFFDGYVNANTKLIEFIHQYDKAVAARRRAESQEDFLCLNSVPNCISNPYEIQVEKCYTRKILKMFQKELVEVMTLFSHELASEESKVTFSVGNFAESRENWEEVSYENCEEIHIKCSCALFETDGILCKHILCILWRNHVTSIPDSYILHRWRLDSRYRNIGFVNAMNLRKNEGTSELRGIIRLWALRAKFNGILEIVSESDIHLSKLEDILEGFTLEVEKEVRLKPVEVQPSQGESQVGSTAPVVILRNGEEITIRDPRGPAVTKGRPKNANRIKSGFERSQVSKEVKQRKCGNCQQLGHYRTNCPLSIKQ